MGNSNKDKTKFIVITGGVLSGLGKGVAAASIGALLGDRLKVVPIKCDGYLNTNPGTMNPTEHGEVFVLDDGGEVDMDFGHYERFLNVEARQSWSLTMGKIFKEIFAKEAEGYYKGKTMQFLPHVTDLIKEKFYSIANQEKADVMLIEIGGTVGDLENQFYIEAVRQLSHEVGYENCLFVHLTYVPIPSGVSEQKSKPTQMSVRELNEKGIYPEVIIGRCSEYLTPVIKEKIALFCNLDSSAVISGVDVKNIYEIPLIYDKEGLPEILHKRLRIYAPPQLRKWSKLVENINRNLDNPQKALQVAICGNHTSLEDSYASVVEALQHACAHLDLKVDVKWLSAKDICTDPEACAQHLSDVSALILPGGNEANAGAGIFKLLKTVRETKLPFLAIGEAMYCAVQEYGQNALKLDFKEDIKEKASFVGGMDIELKETSKLRKIYRIKKKIRERFRYRNKLTPFIVNSIEGHDLVFSGTTNQGVNMTVVELKNHPFYVGCQYHPELKSTLLHPAPLFVELLRVANEYR